MKALIIIIFVFSSLFTINSFAQPAWNYTITSTSHTLVVQSASLNGSPLTAGDYIGVFFSDAGNLYCGGYMLWTGSSGAFNAYGDDPSSGNKEGFIENETLIWQVWQQVNNQIVSMTPILSIGTNSFGNNGMSVISSLNGETVALPIQISAVTTDLTCASTCNGSINLSVTGGTPPFSFEWSNGAATQNVDSLCAGSYQVIVTDYMGTMDSLDIQVNSPSEIIATATLSNYNGFAVSLPGLSDGSIQLTVSGGVSPYAFAWSNSSTNTTLIGLSASKYIVTITDFNGCNSVSSYTLNEPERQIIPLKSGWGIFSTYLTPINPNIANVLSPLGTNLKIAKSGNGQIYWPQYGVNLIGNLQPGCGYQYQLLEADTIEVIGAAINPVETQIILQSNWNILGYIHQYALDIPFLLSDIAPNLIIIKDELGQAYWPQYNVNLIGNLKPGKGYQIKMIQADTLNFSAETFNCFNDERDNNKYRTVKIGNQVWMAENLKYLPSVVSAGTSSSTFLYYYVYGYYGTSVIDAKATANYSTYGVLYNWPSVMAGSISSNINPSGVQGVCPTGWHLPSDAEWAELEGFLGGASVAGAKMKEIGLTHWWGPNVNATNESGFTALPGGNRYSPGTFDGIGSIGKWWSSTEYSSINAWPRVLYNSSSIINRYYASKANAYSVRCVKD